MTSPPRVGLATSLRQRIHLNLHHPAVLDGHRRLGVPIGVSAWIHDLGMNRAARAAMTQCREESHLGRTSDGEETLLALSAALIGGADLDTVVQIVSWCQHQPGPQDSVPSWVVAQVPDVGAVTARRDALSDEVAPTVTSILKEINRLRSADPFTGTQSPLEDRFDWPMEFLGYLHAGLGPHARHLVSNRVPLRIGSRLNLATFQQWRWRDLVKATNADLDLAVALLPLVDDPAMVWANEDDAVQIARIVGPRRALLLLGAGVSVREARTCPADDATLAAMGALRGPVPFPSA